jgi:hypothetical protein
MIDGIGRRLRLVLRQPGAAERQPAAGADPGADPQALPEVEFVAYVEDGRLSGRVRLDTDRLSDMLNDHTEFLLVDVLAESLPDGGTLVVPGYLVRREELVFVHATGPRGDKSRRMYTVPRTVSLKAGPYLVTGQMHGPRAVDPLVHFRRRKPMVPMTDAIVESVSARGPVRESAGTIVVNRDQLEWVRVVDEPDRLPDLPTIRNTRH